EDVGHAESVHPEGGSVVHQRTKVGEVVGIARMPDDETVGGYPRSTKNSCCSRPLRVDGTEWVVMATPVSRWATAAASMTRTTSPVNPAASVAILIIPARTPVPAIPSVMSLTNIVVRASVPSTTRPGPLRAKNRGSDAGVYQPVEATRLTRVLSATRATTAASRPRPGTVRSTTV